jgi:hypothetical protein
MNSNVAIELGYALHALSDRALLMVMNEHYGSRRDLPFDLQAKAGPTMFTLSPDAEKQTIAAASRQLVSRLVHDLKPFVAQKVKAVRRSKPFPQAESKDGPARFRAPGEPIGSMWDLLPSPSKRRGSITLAAGPATWLRLMPTFDPGKKWTAQELLQSSKSGGFFLTPFVFDQLSMVRAADGFGYCHIPSADDAEVISIVFAFETGEVWAIDTWLMGAHPSHLHIAEIERTWIERLSDYGTFLQRLGVQPPYWWIAGVTGADQRELQSPTRPGYARIGSWRGFECVADLIVAEGPYESEQSPISALLPFFEAIYSKCGMNRPDHLPTA